ncbi:MAG TPA: hypothetical protein PJ986_04625 [Gammaproteobacteria bacterium]|nr:hypothetical protein [Gammaproteobacteria bacterium]
MMLDHQNIFSWDQTIVASAASANAFDLGPSSYDRGPGEGLVIAALVTEAFTLLTSLEIKLQCDNDVNFGTPRDLTKLSLTLAELSAKRRITLPVPKERVERYLRLYYTVTGDGPGAGRLSAWLTPADHVDQNNDFRAA